jgi:thiol:disulfide interchange protein
MSWLAAGAVAGVVGYGAFVFSGHGYLKWEQYDEAKLAQHLREGRTVMIDFTADWCLTCQLNKAVAIDTRRVAQLAEKNGVVVMLADKTNPSPHIDTKLEELNSDSIPLLAIYPGSNPSEPIVLRDVLLEGQVVSALEKAGPSKKKASEIKTAMRR